MGDFALKDFDIGRTKIHCLANICDHSFGSATNYVYISPWNQHNRTMATRQTFDINFYCRPSKVNKKGLAPIELSIVINKKRCYLNLQRKERPEEFKAAMASKKTNAIKSYCENQRRLVDDYAERMAFADIELTADNLKECLKRQYVSKAYSLGDLWGDLIGNEKQKLFSGDIVMATYAKYILSKNAFYAANDFTDETPAHTVDIQHVNKLQFYLREQGYDQSTIYNYHARTKAAFTLAFNRGKIKANPYAGFKMSKGEKKDIIWLEPEEIKKIANKDIDIPRLANVRDLLLMQCYTGLAYKDLDMLQKSDFKVNPKDGQIYIEKKRVKTKEKFTAIVLEDGKRILEKYDYELPRLTNQKYNAYLKEIQDICGIQKRLHTHIGRTTYVCTLYNKGVQESVIAKLVGHSTTKTTLKYYAEMQKEALFNAVQEAQKGKRTVAVKASTNLDEVNAAINEYFDKTVYRDAPVPSNADLIELEDTIIAQLTTLKQDNKAKDAYRVSFAKCNSKLSQRLSFVKKTIEKERNAGNDANVRRLQSLQKTYRRLSKTLQQLDANLFRFSK